MTANQIGFHCVGQSVHTGGGGQALGQTQQQSGIQVSSVGTHLDHVLHADLSLAIGVGDDGQSGYFGAGAGGGGDADEGDAGVLVQLRAYCRGVVAAGAGVGDEHSCDLGGVHAAAAADGDADVGAFLAAKRSGFFNRMHRGLDLYLIIDDAFDPVGLESLNAGIDDAGCLDVGAVHHERLVGAELLGDVTDGLAAANTMNDFCNEKLKIVLHNKYLHNY